MPEDRSNETFDRLAAELVPLLMAKGLQAWHLPGYLTVRAGWSAAGPGVVGWSVREVNVTRPAGRTEWVIMETWDEGSTESQPSTGSHELGTFNDEHAALGYLRDRYGV